MRDKIIEEWDDMEECFLPDLLAWAGSVQLTEHESAFIWNSMQHKITEYRGNRFEQMSAKIERTVARSQRRIDQKVALRLQLQTNRLDRRLSAGL